LNLRISDLPDSRMVEFRFEKSLPHPARSGVIPEHWPRRASPRLLGRSFAGPIDGVEFANVSAGVLASGGVALDEPESSPSMSEADASGIASAAVGGAAVLEARYAHCRIESKHPPVDLDCWAFSLDPTGLLSMRGVPADYCLVVVHPVSGEILLNRFGSPGMDASARPDPRLDPA
jgi:hypothetical protein